MRNCYLVLTLATWITVAVAIPKPDPVPQVSSDTPRNIGDNDGESDNSGESNSFDDEIIVVANDREIRLPVPPIGEIVHRGAIPVDVAEEAKVKSAPPGIGCFFRSDPDNDPPPDTSSSSTESNAPEGFLRLSRPSGSSSEPSDSSWGIDEPDNTYVSQTFYSSSSAEEGEIVYFDPPFAYVMMLSCFHLAVNDQQQINENTLALFMDFQSPSGKPISVPGSDVAGPEISRFEAFSLIEDIETSAKRIAVQFGETEVIMTRAAIVHAPPALASTITCDVLGVIARKHRRTASFSVARQLPTPIPEIRLMVCQNPPLTRDELRQMSFIP